MRKVRFKNSRGLNLVGNLDSINASNIIVMAHGFTNDKSSNGRFDKLAGALNKAGFDSLAFDFSGCGESDDDIITAKNQVDDLNSAIHFVLSSGYKKIGLFGNSFGTLACLRSFKKEILTMVLVGALTDSMQYNWNDFFKLEQLEELKRKEFFSLDTKRKHKIAQQTLLDFEQIDQQKMIKNVACPVLILHGNNLEDKEEIQLLKRSNRAIALLPPDSKLKIIEGGKHGLRNEWNQVINISVDWYNRYLG